jgi:hypothetical protein
MLIIGDGRTDTREVFLICNDRLMHTVTAASVYKMSANVSFQQYSRFSNFVILDVQGFRPFIITDFNTFVSTSRDCFDAEFVLCCIVRTAACSLCFARSHPHPPPPCLLS